MNEPNRAHPSEEVLERFLLSMSPEEELNTVETHIIACGYCVEQLETLETQIAATQMALRELEAEEASKRSAKPPGYWRRWFTLPKLSIAGAGALAAAGAVFFSIPRDVSLTAYRGLETAIVSEGRPLHMHLNAADLAGGPIAVELVDSNGSSVWKGTSVVRHDQVDVTLPRITKSGAHYLRLYSLPQAGNEGDLLREFAIVVK
jgi:hypothetical protein